ncbi:unnamed protein product, partial [Dovyalis caffra]
GRGSALKLFERMKKDSSKPNVKTYAPLSKTSYRKKNMRLLKFLWSHLFKNNKKRKNQLHMNRKLEHACFYFQEALLKGMVPMDTTYKLLLKKLERQNMAELKGKIEKLMLQAKVEQENRKCDGAEPR